LLTHRPTQIDIDEPLSVTEIVRAALRAFGRYPALFALLALAVVAPYELVVLAVTGAAPLGEPNVSAATWLTLTLVDFALIGPLVSALYVQAVITMGHGEPPRLADVARRGLKVLPVVVAAQIIAGLGIGVGLFLLIVPGIILAIRWAVVAQVAAIERTDWIGALRRSAELTRGHYAHVLGLLALTSAVTLGVTLAGEAIAGNGAHAPEVILGIAVATLTRMFAALNTAILYFDLLARSRGVAR
jgi:hypothetical protein